MSRSNPIENIPNPATRWFQWDGAKGLVRYYDKEASNPAAKTGQGRNVELALPFHFVLLDELSSVRGWSESLGSGIYANEIRDVKSDVLIVKAFKGAPRPIAEGVYSAIRDRVKAAGAHFVTNCYIGYKLGERLILASLQFKGAALSAWMEFKRSCPTSLINGRSIPDYYSKAITITGSGSGRKGAIVYKFPTFTLKELSAETNAEAMRLDEILQGYLKCYLARTKTEQVAVVASTEPPLGDAAEPVNGNDSDYPQEPDYGEGDYIPY